MSLPLNWMVLFFFIVLVVIFLIVFEINSKFKWRKRAFELEDEIKNLNRQVSDPTNIKKEFDSVINEVKQKLTNKQFQIFLSVIEGFSSKEIGDKINVSPATIDSHIKEILKSLNLTKRSQLANLIIKKVMNLDIETNNHGNNKPNL